MATPEQHPAEAYSQFVDPEVQEPLHVGAEILASLGEVAVVGELIESLRPHMSQHEAQDVIDDPALAA